jgi:hypothetical protein
VPVYRAGVSTVLVIPSRFRGPDTSGNGGWTCGSVAALADGPVEVTLRRPPPLDVELRVDHGDDGLRVLDGDDLVAEAHPVDGSSPDPVPDPVDLDRARVAAGRYGGRHDHPFPHCFTCGPARGEGDGLRIFTGPVEGRPGVVAAPFTPPADLVDDHDRLTVPAVWAALDCPTAWPHMADGTVAVLGRLRATVHGPAPAADTYVAVGRHEGGEGRKRFGSGALYTPEGELVASSFATWITVG